MNQEQLKKVGIFAFITTSMVVTGFFLFNRLDPHNHSAANVSKPLEPNPIQFVESKTNAMVDGKQPVSVATNQFSAKIGEFDVAFDIGVLDVGFEPKTKPENLASVYDNLVEKALSGDAVAARVLSLELWDCRFSHKSRDELESALAQINNTGIAVFPDAEGGHDWEVNLRKEGLSNEEIEKRTISVSGTLQARVTRCKELDEEKMSIAAIESWAELAAEKGDYLALQHLKYLNRKSPVKAVQWNEEVWEQTGDISSLSSLVGYYSRGLPSGKDDETLIPDYTRAYAAHLAYSAVHESSLQYYESLNPRMAYQYRETAAINSARLASNLTVQETFEAERIAAELLNNNENCCTSPIWQSYIDRSAK